MTRHGGSGHTAATALLVVDAGLLSYLEPVVVGPAGRDRGTGLRRGRRDAAGLGWRGDRAPHVLAAVVAGLVLMVTSTTMLAVNAAEQA
ncbi:hypothetical protein ABT262_15140, partial [Amycolatopsis mediterranei]